MPPTVIEISSSSSKDSAFREDLPATSGPQDRLETNQNGPDFVMITGETNDDGLLEDISVCEFNKVCVTTIDTSSKRVYQNSTWQTVGLVAVQDTDGDPGAEIVVVAYTREGLLACVCVIHDKAKSIEFYRGPGWSSVEIKTVANTDGIGGEEIIIQVKNGEGSLHCLCVIRDRDRTVREYGDVTWTSIEVKEVEDTDGQLGKEVIFESRDATGQLICVCVLRDHKNELVTYTDSQWMMGQIQLLADTDGQPGLEVLVTFTTLSDSGITIIHDATRTSKTYRFEGHHTIQQVRDYDRSKGEEICVLLPTRDEYLLITDRVQEKEVIESCGHQKKLGVGT